jgi:hypothetical protein
MSNLFTLEAKDYSRDLDVLKHYTNDAAYYLSKMKGIPIETCKAFVRKTLANKESGIVDREMLTLARNKYGDREKSVITFSEYLREVEQENYIISPTMCVYNNPKQKKSVLSQFVGINIGKRNVSKGEMFQAERDGNEELFIYKSNEQTSFKLGNNSLSGAQASTGTILHNKSAHSSLTSTCRTATSYGNANNEKFMFGNRHYWSLEIVLNNIVSICSRADLETIAKVVEKYNIVLPNVEQTMECISYSTDLYYLYNEESENKIRGLITNLTPLERAAFVYTSDLYHLAKYNDGLVREFLDKLSSKSEEKVDDPDKYIGVMDSDLKAFVSLLSADELKGTDLKKLKVEDYEKYRVVGATTKKILETLEEYKLLIQGLWRTNSLPASVSTIRNSVRRGVVTSDTDSTIFTTQYWTEWFVGRLDFSTKSCNISYAVTYLATQTNVHNLATISAGMGVEEKEIFTLAMKNEFAFPVFALTSMAKHYYAYISAREGNVYEEYDTEIKGVQLKDSNVPTYIMKIFDQTLKDVMDVILRGEKISIVELQTKIAKIEDDIFKSVLRGDGEYLKNAQVKTAESYVNPNVSPYVYYTLWQDVFSQKYGEQVDIPYAGVKVSVDLDNKTKLNNWFDNMEDQELAARFKDWMARNKKNAIRSIILPKALISEKGLPKEVIDVMNIRKLVFNTVRPFYLQMESLGIYMINDNITRLVSDEIKV